MLQTVVRMDIDGAAGNYLGLASKRVMSRNACASFGAVHGDDGEIGPNGNSAMAARRPWLGIETK